MRKLNTKPKATIRNLIQQGLPESVVVGVVEPTPENIWYLRVVQRLKEYNIHDGPPHLKRLYENGTTPDDASMAVYQTFIDYGIVRPQCSLESSSQSQR